MNIKAFFEQFYKKKHFIQRLIAVICGVITMGFCLSLLINVDWGLDPYTLMNKAISETLGLSIGNWQAILNSLLFIIVLIFGRNNIGVGTLANMFLVGYSLDFFRWLWTVLLPEDFFDPLAVKIAIFIPALLLFVFAVAVYIDMELGASPYDSIPQILAVHFPKLPFLWVRMIFDFSAIGLGLLFGGRLQMATVLMALLLGPVIGYVSSFIKKKWNFHEA